MTAIDDTVPRQFYHGTRANLTPGDLIAPGYSSNYGQRKQGSWVYLTGTLEAGRLGRRAGRRRRARPDLRR